MTLHMGLRYFFHCAKFQSYTPYGLTEKDNNNNNKMKNNYISLVTDANLTILLADVHIDSGYLVVVTKEGSD